MSVQISGIRLSGGLGHEHIVRVWFLNEANGEVGSSSTVDFAAWLDESTVGAAYVVDVHGDRVPVGVVTPATGAKYVCAYDGGGWTDDLLALPRR